MASVFEELGVHQKLVQALHKQGITEPTPIQEQAMPLLLGGQDLIGQAQTGTGKTLAFILPILERLDVQVKGIQALIVAPTRELALQITEELEKYAPAVGATALAVYGGQDVERQIRRLKGETQIVVGTPGRILDHLRRGTIDFGGLNVLVLDEADQMLHMGFLEDVEQIIYHTPATRQTLLFSATMPKSIRSLATRYMKSPQEIRIQPQKPTLEEIKQVIIETTDRQKQDALCDSLKEYQPFLAIVFCRTKRRASTLNEALLRRGFLSDELHGDLSQAKREQVMKRFRNAQIQILVATDVAARGLDVEGVTHVFNYDIPHDLESYIHRIGRTGRAGQEGVAVTFVAPKDRGFLQMIEKGIPLPMEKRMLLSNAAAPRTAGEMKGRSRSQAGKAERVTRRKEGPGKRNEGPGKRNEGPGKRNEGPGKRNEGPGKRNEGPSKRNEGPSKRNEGPGKKKEGPDRRNEGPGKRKESTDGRKRKPTEEARQERSAGNRSHQKKRADGHRQERSSGDRNNQGRGRRGSRSPR